ncbi:MAG TPA: hypothetical protein PLN69_06770 [bacterium]|nr:hypothetical protein [bacterium]
MTGISPGRTIVFLILIISLVMAVCADADMPGARIESVEVTRSGVRVAIDQGLDDGLVPGMIFETGREGRKTGRLELDVVGENESEGIFESACEGCAPMVGDVALLSEESFRISMPPILVPGAAKAEAPVMSDEDSKPLRMAFRMFMSGEKPEAGEKKEAEAEYAPPPCAGNGPEPERIPGELKTEIFIEPGDRFMVEGWAEYSPFCPVVGDGGLLEMPEIGAMETSGKTVSVVERLIRERIMDAGGDAKPVLSPIKKGMPFAVIMVLGQVGEPGYYEIESGVWVEDVARMAGGLSGESDGTALIVGDPSKRKLMTLVKIDEMAECEDCVPPVVGGIVFFPSSRENREEFLREVLPYLNAVE